MKVLVLSSLLIWVSTLSITCVKLVIHCIVWLILVMPAVVNVSFVKDFDFRQVQFCEERAKNSTINMYARQLTSGRKRQLSFTGNYHYSVLKTSSSSRTPTTLISSETTFPIAAVSMTSDVTPNAPTAGEAVAPISTSSGRVLRRPTHYKDTRR